MIHVLQGGDEAQTQIRKKLDDNLFYLNERLDIGEKNFDLILREFIIGGKRAALLFVDGLLSGQITTLVINALLQARREDIVPDTTGKMIQEIIPYMEVSVVDDLEEAMREFLAGPMVLFIDGERRAILIDTREYPGRTPDEPDVERITRGSRDGFVETLIFNIALIRRRIRDPRLRVEAVKIGRRSVTDVALLYIEDIAFPEIVKRVRSRLKKINVDALPMAEKTVEEYLVASFWNPFPEVRYTERPDVAAAHLLEGHVLIIVDTSPSVMIAPVTLFHHLQHAEEFRHDAIIGTYIRWVRLTGIFLSFFLIPIWMLLVLEPGLRPQALNFIGPKHEASIPLFLQFVIAHFGLDLLRMASIHTPSPFATALGLLAGLLIGQIAVEVGFFVPEVLLYTGLTAIGVFSTPSWELSMANRVVLLLMLILTGTLHLPGFLIGVTLLTLRLFTTSSFGFSYLWPLFPFDLPSLVRVFLRQPLPLQRFRPSYLRTRDRDRTVRKQPEG